MFGFLAALFQQLLGKAAAKVGELAVVPRAAEAAPIVAPKPSQTSPNAPFEALTKNRDIDTLARTIYGEARGESLNGKQAVANVIRNRVRYAAASSAAARRFGKGYEGVCRKPWQFSCWNLTDPNRAKINSVTVKDATFRECLALAAATVNGTLTDNVAGATYYHTTAVSPAWARGVKPILRIGTHVFYQYNQIA